MTDARYRAQRATRAAGALVAARHRVALALVAGLVVVAGLGLPGLGTSVTTDTFLDADNPAAVATRDRNAMFGDDPIVVLFEVAAEQAVVAPMLPALVVLERDLAALSGVARVDGPGTVIASVTSGVAGMLGGILGTVDGARLEAADAARRAAEAEGASPEEVEAAMVEAIDGAGDEQMVRYGPLLAENLRLGLPELDNPAFTSAIALDASGAPRPLVELVVPDAGHVAIQIRPSRSDDADAVSALVAEVRRTVAGSPLGDLPHRVTGAPVVTATVAADVRSELPSLALLGTLAMALLLLFANRAPRPLAPLLGVGAGLVVGLGTLGWLQLDLGLGAVAVAPVVLGLGTDFGVNVGQWYAHARAGGASPVDAVGEAWVRTLPPLGLASLVATAAASVALLSPSPAIRALGIALPVTLLLSLVLTLVVNGALLATATDAARVAPWDRLRARVAAARLERAARAGLGGRGGRADLGGGRPRWATTTAGAVLVVGIAGWVALPFLAVEADLPALIGDSEELTDARAAERILGAAGTVELIVEADDVTDPAVLRWMDAVVGEVVRREGPEVRGLLWPDRVLSWLGPDADAAAIQRGLDALPATLTSAVLRPDDGAAVATFGVPWSSSSEQAQLLATLREVTAEPPPGVTARLAGMPVLVAAAYDGVATTPVRDTLVGLVAAAAVLAVVLRRRSWMPVAVLVGAAGLRFAVIAAMGGQLNPITLALVAFVAAVDAEFALVFLAARRLGEEGRRMATRVTGVSAATAALGFGVLTLSSIAGVREFGLMAAVAVLAGWLGAVALFSGPLRPRGTAATPRRVPASAKLAAPVTAALLLAGCTGASTLPDGVLVSVDGIDITEDDLADRTDQLRALYQLDVPAPGSEEHGAFRQDLLASMVAVAVVERGAQERGVRVPEADVIDQLEAYRAASYPWDDGYRASLAATGTGEGQLREELRYQLLQARVFDDVTADVEVADEDVVAAFERDPDRFDLPERRRVRHVVVPDEESAEQVRAALADGTPFEEVAASVSLDDATSADGGDLGTVREDQLLEGFGPAVFALEVGEISAPIVSDFGVHVAEVTAIEPAGQAPLEEIVVALRGQLEDEQREQRWTRWLQEAWAMVDIRYAEGIDPVEPPGGADPVLPDGAEDGPDGLAPDAPTSDGPTSDAPTPDEPTPDEPTPDDP